MSPEQQKEVQQQIEQMKARQQSTADSATCFVQCRP